MTHNGFENADSYLWDVEWSNRQALYEAIKSHARAMRPVWEVMTNQTLGRNMKDAVRAALSDGGWGWRSCPDELVAVRSVLQEVAKTVDFDRIGEETFGSHIRAALGGDE